MQKRDDTGVLSHVQRCRLAVLGCHHLGKPQSSTNFALQVTPWAARQAVARGDYDNVSTFPAIAWGVVLVLNALALIVGLIGVRQPTAMALSGATIVGMFIYVIGTVVVMPRVG